jgi:hypothetical protein
MIEVPENPTNVQFLIVVILLGIIKFSILFPLRYKSVPLPEELFNGFESKLLNSILHHAVKSDIYKDSR